MRTNQILQGHILDVLKTLPTESIDCVITSPPYWSLRDYATKPQIWDGDKNCKHLWIKHIKRSAGGKGGENADVGANRNDFANMRDHKVITNFCSKCGAWKGNLGLEPTFDLYIKHLCDIFDEVKRILKKEGSCWVNMGDSYGGFQGKNAGWPDSKTRAPIPQQQKPKQFSKCLLNIPHRFAIRMCERGWIQRNAIIWKKPNCMPTSARDRFTIDFEYFFFFVKNKKYYFEKQLEPYLTHENRPMGIVRERNFDYDTQYPRVRRKMPPIGGVKQVEGNKNPTYSGNRPFYKQGRNKRCVWTITTKPYKEAHFAVFPEKLIETPIKSSCPKFVCNKCGKPRHKRFGKKEYLGTEKSRGPKYKNSKVHSAGGREHYYSEQIKNPPDRKRLVDYLRIWQGDYTYKQLDKLFNKKGDCASHWFTYPESEHGFSYPSPQDWMALKKILNFDNSFDKSMTETVKVLIDDKGKGSKFIGYTNCNCGAGFSPGIALDPFIGSGTTAVVAKTLGRNWLGIELNPKYIKMAEKRIANAQKSMF